jgi:diguanylate cyclase (GGDEF)-like protein
MDTRERYKKPLSFLLLASLLVLALMATALYSFRQVSIEGAEQRARTAAEIIRISLTEYMVNGMIGKAGQLLGRVRQSAGLEEVRVVRGADIVRQFGTGAGGELARDALDKSVLASGHARYVLVDGDHGVALRAVIPYVAERIGQVNCLNCHQAAVGDVLGAVNIRISLTNTLSTALAWVAILVGITSLLALAALYLMRRQFQPVAEVAMGMNAVVTKAIGGDFSARLPMKRSDAVGHIATGVNRLMENLGENLGTIYAKVAQLMEYDQPCSSNLLLATLEMVEHLVDVNRFRQVIEGDESKWEIYKRLNTVIREDFSIDKMSIYEVANSKNHMRAAMVDGKADGAVHWCDPEILIRADACRARRSGHIVNGIEEPGICQMFRPGPGTAGMGHVCLPLMEGGNVSCIVQLVSSADTAPLVSVLVPFVRVYLREMTPVLESKRLTDHLRESSLHDSMTGLYNRRFLEEYVDTLQATLKREKSTLAVLMLDVDHFKTVNDTYGHDCGDKVLVSIAHQIKQTLRQSDILVRYGGEEFLIVQIHTDAHGGLTSADKVRVAIERLKISVSDFVIQKTISIGVAEFPGDSADFWQAVKCADTALYIAKKRGRNCVVRYSDDLQKIDEAEMLA